MKMIRYFLFVTAIGLGACRNTPQSPRENLTPWVDPFIGVEIGNTLPGVNLPFGMVRLGPDVAPPNNTSGYRSGEPIRGFSHNHLSGTGGGARYGNVLVIPQIGSKELYPKPRKTNEYARPGYYGVTLCSPRGNVICELTASERVGMHRYTFTELAEADQVEVHFNYRKVDGIDANILIDAGAIIDMVVAEPTHTVGSRVKIVSDTLVEGRGDFRGGWGGENPYSVYFAASFDRPCTSSGVWTEDIFAGGREVDGKNTGAWFHFALGQRGQVQMKVAISYVSTEKARENLLGVPGWDFDATRNRADSIWNDHLNLIRVEGGTPELRTVFYTALYHTMTMPTLMGNDENPSWDSDVCHYWDFYTLWDTFRTAMPLHTLILPERQVEIVRCLLDIYDHRGWLPDAWTAGDYAYVQGGSNADVVMADAAVKGLLSGAELEKAYQAVKKNGEVVSDNPYKYGRYLYEYEKYGYLPSAVKNGSSKTLEYAYNDFCIGQIARMLGRKAEAEIFFDRSYFSMNLYDPETHFFWAKDQAGEWVPGFSPTFKRPDSWNGPYFYEGSPWYYATYFPHDMRFLIGKHGGEENFVKFLDELFDGENFEMGNEPGFLTPYLYHYAGRPDRSADRIRLLLREFRTGRQGLPGQEDSGAMSAWYMFGAMGFYPVAGQDIYLIGTPHFTRTTLDLGGGKQFEIHAPGVSEQNRYVHGATLNGHPLDRNWFRHRDIADGGELFLQMGPDPSGWGQDTPPPSLSDPQ